MDSDIRAELKNLGKDTRFRFSGNFIKYGFKYADRNKVHAVPTILLGNIHLIKDDGKQILLTDHLWFNLTKGFKELGILHVGETVSFNGRIAEYTKGYQGSDDSIHKPVKVDYNIERPTKVKLDISLYSQNMLWPTENWELCNKIYDMYFDDYKSRNIAMPYSSF